MSSKGSNNQFYNEIGEQIRESLSKGLSTGDLSGLNSAITDSVRSVIKEASSAVGDSLKTASVEVADSLKNAGPHYGYKKPHSTPEESQKYMAELQRKRMEREVARENAKKASQNDLRSNSKSTALRVQEKALPANFNPVGKGSSTALVAVGATGATFAGIAAVKGLAAFAFAAGGLTGFIVPAVFAAGFGAMIKKGFHDKDMLSRAKRYAEVCGNNMYAQISSLAASLGTTTKKVKKDIKKMLRKGYFPQGYLDEEETTLMISTDVYKQYQQTKQYSLSTIAGEVVSDFKVDENDPVSIAKAKLSPAQRKELEKMVEEGRSYIDKLHKLNDKIPGEHFSNKLDKLETLLKEIFRNVELHPEQMARMHKLMDYYLPTMIKLVEAYKEYDDVSNPGQSIIDAKAEIERTLDTINEAFVELLNNLFRDSVWDVTSDAQVLQTMLKQEGLAKDVKNNE